MQVLALGLVKFSVLFFYRRIFCIGNARAFSILTIIMITVVALWTSGFFISWVFICRGDPEAYWISFASEAAHCVDTGMLHNAYAISDFATDALILLLPIWPVYMIFPLSVRSAIANDSLGRETPHVNRTEACAAWCFHAWHAYCGCFSDKDGRLPKSNESEIHTGRQGGY